MESRWKELTKALFSSPEAREKWWDRICQALAGKEGRRHYYNLENLENRFVLFDKYQNQLSNPTAVALAMFLQHLHYDPRIPGISEELTLAMLQDFITDVDQADEKVIRGLRELLEAALINSTPVHLTPDVTGTDDVHYFLDMEMAVLGASPKEYREHFDYLKMKEEYGIASDYDYFQLRLKVLKYFLQIPNIYATKEFRAQYDKQARCNITNEISNIEKQLTEVSHSQ